MITGAHKTQRMVSALTFLERNHKDGDEFLNRIVRVTGDETWVSIVNVETNEQSKQWMHTHSPNMPKKKVSQNVCLPES
jgi:exosome complex RNA-binding protein Csl4